MTDFLTKLKTISKSRRSSAGSASSPEVSEQSTLSGGPASGDKESKAGKSSQQRHGFPSAMQTAIESAQRAVKDAHGPGRKRPLYQRWWAWGIVGLGFGLSGSGIAAWRTIEVIKHDLPNTTNALSYVRTGSLLIKTTDGTVLQQIGPATREKVALKKMPGHLPEAFIASEDQEFYRHDGINYGAIARATLKNLLARDVVEGGSTITQQLARIVFLDQERTMGRKLREALVAQKMEQELTKDQILERYMNLVYLGSGAYGVADAAWIYFSKRVEQLTLGEMAMIAGMAPAPSDYSPLIDPELARQRRNIVLERMAYVGYITEAELEAAKASPIKVKPGAQKYIKSEAPYFTSYVQQELPRLIPKDELELGGLTVETTLNLKWQKLAQETINYAIRNYGPYEGFGQGALASIDPHSGEIKALVGGDDFGKSQFNRATQAQRQPGSTFKAFVYATAIEAGFSPYRSYIDGKYVVDGYEPHNYEKTSYRGSVSMKDALASSINIVAVKTLVDVGFDPVIDLAKRMGIKSTLLPAYSLALGTSEVNLLELTNAYGTLADQGNHIEAHAITRVYNRFGKLIYQAKFKPQRALDADSASIMTWMLESVVANGTGQNAYLSGRQVAGKTGTSEKRRDLWFVGYIPQLVTGVWLGNDDSSPTGGQSSTAALTWYNFMVDATKGMPVEKFPQVPDLDSRQGSIKAKPVKPARVYASDNPYPSRVSDSDSEGSDSSSRSSESSGGWSSSRSSDSYSGSYSSGSRSDSSSGNSKEPAPSQTNVKHSAPAPEPEPPASVAPTPYDLSPVAPAPAQNNAPAPISDPPPISAPPVPPSEPAPPAPAKP